MTVLLWHPKNSTVNNQSPRQQVRAQVNRFFRPPPHPPATANWIKIFTLNPQYWSSVAEWSGLGLKGLIRTIDKWMIMPRHTKTYGTWSSSGPASGLPGSRNLYRLVAPTPPNPTLSRRRCEWLRTRKESLKNGMEFLRFKPRIELNV